RMLVIDAKTGEVLERTRVVDEVTLAEKLEPGIKIQGLLPARYPYASPVVAEKNLFFFDDAGHTAVFELGRGGKFVRANTLEDACVGTPFFIRDKIILRGSQTVYCIGEKP
ncbi:MAG: hypothetical protein JWM11_198, partial [Planctomycetaceae bacterium]|nr:hypothetical protein [Planctomycetaceae bacterium]